MVVPPRGRGDKKVGCRPPGGNVRYSAQTHLSALADATARRSVAYLVDCSPRCIKHITNLIPMKFYKRFYVILFAAVCFLSVVGCGKTNVPLRGRVLDQEGNPITVGMVNFSSEKGLSRGKIQPDGSYTVGTLKQTDGLPPGTYKVYVTNAEVPLAPKEPPKGPQQLDAMGQPMQPMMFNTRKLVARQYMTEADTPLTCEVPVKGNRFDVVVEKP